MYGMPFCVIIHELHSLKMVRFGLNTVAKAISAEHLKVVTHTHTHTQTKLLSKSLGRATILRGAGHRHTTVLVQTGMSGYIMSKSIYSKEEAMYDRQRNA